MWINYPLCNLKTCRKQFDGNCVDKSAYEKCESAELLNNNRTKIAHWVKVNGYCTPGGDPVWCCSNCGKGVHVYGIEHGSYGSDISDGQWVACPNCGCKMIEE